VRLELNFLALSMWLWGGMLYIWMMSLIFYRYTFFTLEPGDLSPPYWINMGAMAISTLSGSLLILNSTDAPFLHLAAALHQGLHGVLLGHRHLVDPDAAGAGDVAPCLPALSAALRPALLGRGVPARHVRGLHRTHDRGDGLRVPGLPATRLLQVAHLQRHARVGGQQASWRIRKSQYSVVNGQARSPGALPGS
jgi:hypothetical protein